MKRCFKCAFLPLKSWNLGIWGVKVMWMLTFTSLNLLSKVDSRSNPDGARYTVEKTPEVLPATWVVWGWEVDCPWDGRAQEQAGSSFRNYSVWSEVGLGEADNARCSHGDAGSWTFAPYHEQKVVSSGTTPVELASDFANTVIAGFLPDPRERKHVPKTKGKETQSVQRTQLGTLHVWALSLQWKLQDLSAGMDCVSASNQTHGKTEHAWNFFFPSSFIEI